ncbi:response regulator [Ohtaekwangia koreensis]|uniref:CheY chemotaxis protein or a CheY-like REC (Receiver) domain n=1 Tax=Ohtaekwangia koreensis TaxID=688867 RepID=A0A1T5K1B9_9BACT|nr:response regulator [Ohtaekwangia koreensis]SKC57466.1 CheY chemotaxis protein or a CheY-like REC (receiver) domain [Ohtaekwangia koreensis]
MEEFSLRESCYKLANKLNRYRTVLLKLNIDVQLNDAYLGNGDRLVGAVKHGCLFLAKSFDINEVFIEITKKDQFDNITTIVIDITGYDRENMKIDLSKGNEKKITFPFRLINAPTENTKHPFEGKKVLIVEDSRINAMVFQSLLEGWGCDTRLAETGEDTVSMVYEEQFDLILMDDLILGQDGNTSTQKIREFNKYVPIISCLTSPVVKESIAASLNAGASSCLLKPVNSAELFRILCKYLYKTSTTQIGMHLTNILQ